MMLSRTTARVAIRHYSRSAVARAEPKMHKATENWDALMSKRPVDPDDLHKVFHPPFNAGTVLLLIGSIVGIGGGSMWYGVVHQQYKQGFWK